MRETLTRLLSGIVYILLLAAAMYFPDSFLLLFGVFLMIAIIEFCNLVNLKVTAPLVMAAAGYFLFAFFDTPQLTLQLLLLATLFVSVRCIAFLFDDKARIGDQTSKYIYLIGYIILPFVLLARIPFFSGIYQPEVIFGMFILIWTNDTFAFIVGKTMGQNKLFEKISPKKTIEGFIGGAGFSLVASAIIARYLNDQLFFWVVIAVIVSVIGTAGDLVESKFKRLAGVKDSGKIMPGHGGILDRLDSVIFAAPFVFLFYQILYYVS